MEIDGNVKNMEKSRKSIGVCQIVTIFLFTRFAVEFDR